MHIIACFSTKSLRSAAVLRLKMTALKHRIILPECKKILWAISGTARDRSCQHILFFAEKGASQKHLDYAVEAAEAFGKKISIIKVAEAEDLYAAIDYIAAKP